uniref:Uncharacterized protein n=1 Tax=Solanum tuberosum TaxID=4113 RepID=M1DXL2_SOLTU
MTNAFEPIGSHTHENTLEEVDLRDTFLYYLFTYDEAHAVEWSMLFEGKSNNLVNGCALDPSTWLAFPFDPSSELNCSICVGMFGRNGRQMVVDVVNSFPYARKLFLRFYHPLEGPTFYVDIFPVEGETCTFIYYLFAYDEIPSWIKCALHVDQGILEVYTCWYDHVLWTFYPFDPGGCFKAFELVGVSSFGWYSHVVEKNDHCPCSPLVVLIAMTIEDVWLFLEFESPRLNVLSANLCTTHHAKRINFLLVTYMVLQGLDSRTQFYLLAFDDTHACMGSISYVSSGINKENESLLDSMLFDPFPFDLGADYKCVECSSNAVYHSYNSSLVLLLDPMCLNEVCLPIFVGDTYVLELAHELGIITLLKLSGALDGALIWVNITCAFALSLSIHELQCFDGVFTGMEVVWHVWMPMREFHALHGNICTLKELPVGQHHAWMIAWSMGGLTKQGGASEEGAPFGELKDTSATRQSPLVRVPELPTDPMSSKWRYCSIR